MQFTNVIPVLVALVAAFPVYAADYIDQAQNNRPVYMAAFSQGNLAQSFTAGQSNVSGGGVGLQFAVTSSFSVNFGLWTALPNAFGAVNLATGVATVNAGDTWADAFWTPVAVTPGMQYFLTFDSTSSNGVAGDTSNPYVGGNVYANGGYGSFGAFDYSFHTYSSDATGAVPEPATWALALTGFALVGGAARRRRATVAA